MSTLKFILGWAGKNPSLPFAKDVEDPKHGQKAKNSKHQKVIYDAEERNTVTGKMGTWVTPQNFSGREPVVIRGNGYQYTEFGIFAEDDVEFEHPLTLDDVLDIREAERGQQTPNP